MIKVMLVDDSSIVTNMVSSYLSTKGYMVTVANSPFGVSNKVKEFKPEVILMDLGLPGLSGEKLINVCREKETGHHSRIVLFSSTDEDVMKEMVVRGIADDYFIKGGSLKDLEDKIRTQARALHH
ncbi:MAG: response regulator [Nitrospirae bacterium]|nr:response regulator [Nitrospirota bacterium]MBI5696067.1 response regulator [Nitrospirota bacterium]